jgi:ribosome-binding factor A
MSIDRLERINALIRREIGDALFKVFVGDSIDLASITITHVQTARNLRNATVSVSVFGHASERGAYLRKLADKAGELQKLINSDLSLKYTPRLRFVLDGSVEKGDHVLDVLNKLDIPADAPGDAAAPGPSSL